ncbi:hypothetical protein HYU11_01000 [Candidatus Woesearchaeota archaeon]|nr:hypothetical protein [Candidatus Woesearchaeota archaeon]
MEKEVNEKGSADISSVRYENLSRRMKGLESLNNTLRDHIHEKEMLDSELSKEYSYQLTHKEDVIRSLALKKDECELLHSRVKELESLNAKLTGEIEMLENAGGELDDEFRAQLDQRDQIIKGLCSKDSRLELESLRKRVGELSSSNEKLRDHILLRDSLERAMAKEFSKQMEKKEETIQRLISSKSSALSQERDFSSIEREIESGLEIVREENRVLKAKLEEKTEELGSSLRYQREKDASYDEIQAQLSYQLKEKVHEISRLKAFIAQREDLSQRSEEQLMKELAEKETEIKSLRRNKEERPSDLRLEHARQIIQLKDAASKKHYLETIKLKESLSLLEKEIENEKARYEKSRAYYEKIIASIKKDSDRSARDLIAEYSERQINDKAEIEKLKGQLGESQLQLKIERQKIDNAIREFNIRSVQLMEMGGQPSKDFQQVKKEEPVDLSEYEKKAKAIRESLNRREIDLNRREGEIHVKSSKVEENQSEIKRMLVSIEERIKLVEKREESLGRREQLLLKQQDAFNRELDALGKVNREPVQKAEYDKPKIASEPKAKVHAKEQVVDKQQSDERTLGYPEVDEIVSMIEVALQHKDTPEQVRNSLISSGYSKESIDKAMRRMKLA